MPKGRIQPGQKFASVSTTQEENMKKIIKLNVPPKCKTIKKIKYKHKNNCEQIKKKRKTFKNRTKHF
jgi:hypothetical protein